jgi:hypothetical protein
MSKIHFTEEQSIPSIWRLLIFGGVTLMVGFVTLMVFLTEWKTMPNPEKLSMMMVLIGPLATLIIFFIRLDVRITPVTFEYKVHPFRTKYKVIPFSKITSIELMKPKGFKSFQGVGTHRNINRTEMNFGGKNLVTFTLTSGRIISITTNKPQELKSFLLNLPEGGPAVKVDS